MLYVLFTHTPRKGAQTRRVKDRRLQYGVACESEAGTHRMAKLLGLLES